MFGVICGSLFVDLEGHLPHFTALSLSLFLHPHPVVSSLYQAVPLMCRAAICPHTPFGTRWAGHFSFLHAYFYSVMGLVPYTWFIPINV